jgi:hypothetical protein
MFRSIATWFVLAAVVAATAQPSLAKGPNLTRRISGGNLKLSNLKPAARPRVMQSLKPSGASLSQLTTTRSATLRNTKNLVPRNFSNGTNSSNLGSLVGRSATTPAIGRQIVGNNGNLQAVNNAARGAIAPGNFGGTQSSTPTPITGIAPVGGNFGNHVADRARDLMPDGSTDVDLGNAGNTGNTRVRDGIPSIVGIGGNDDAANTGNTRVRDRIPDIGGHEDNDDAANAGNTRVTDRIPGIGGRDFEAPAEQPGDEVGVGYEDREPIAPAPDEVGVGYEDLEPIAPAPDETGVAVPDLDPIEEAPVEVAPPFDPGALLGTVSDLVSQFAGGAVGGGAGGVVEEAAPLEEVPAEQAAVEPVDSVDIEIVEVRLVDAGNLGQNVGPRLRLFCRNNGTLETTRFHVSLLVDLGKQPTSRAYLTTVESVGVLPGRKHVLDVQLPPEVLKMSTPSDKWARPFETLAAFVDSDERLVETDENNNVLLVARDAIEPVASNVAD